MKSEITEKDDVIIIALEGGMVGGPDAARLSEKLRDLVSSGKKKIIVDMEKVDWMNSSGLGILIGSMTTVKNHGGVLKLMHLDRKVKELLRITKLDRVFDVYEDEGEAIDSFT